MYEQLSIAHFCPSAINLQHDSKYLQTILL